MRLKLLGGLAAGLLAFVPCADAAARTGPVELGTAVGGAPFMSDTDPRYRGTLELFDALTAENDMKMYYQRPTRDRFEFAAGDAMVAFAQARGKKVHGHTLVWCNDSSNPGWMRNRTWTRAQLLDVMEEHITTVASHYRGRVSSWDVVNEALADDGTRRDCLWQRVIGDDWIEQAFRMADRADPSARLFYNEVRADAPNPKYEAMLRLARDFMARGVPLDGIGLQYHLTENHPTQSQMEEAIRRIGELSLEVHISELDVPIWYLGPRTIPERLALQPEIYRRVATACQAQPACFRITTWGFTDRFTWRCCNAKPLPFDEEYNPKPAWAVLQEVLRPRAASGPPPPAPAAEAQSSARQEPPLAVSVKVRRKRMRTLLRRRALFVTLGLSGAGSARVTLVARVRGRALGRAVIPILAGRAGPAAVPLSHRARQRLRRLGAARVAVEAVAVDPAGRRAKAVERVDIGR